MGPQASRPRRKEREEMSHRSRGSETGGVAAQAVGQWRKLRTVARSQPPGTSRSIRIN
jgi:hypothetical protein